MATASAQEVVDGVQDTDPVHLEAARAALDPALAAVFAEAPRMALVDLLDRVVSDVRTGDLTEARARLVHVDAALARLVVSSLEPRRGLAGLFDGRSKRLKAFRADYAEAARTVTDTAAELSERAGAVTRRDAGLETLWGGLRKAIADLDVHLEAGRAACAPSPGEDEADPHAVLRARLGVLAGCREAAVAALPRIRSAQNADVPALAALNACAAAVATWREDWADGLGLSGRKARRLRPDPVRLETAKAALQKALADSTTRLDAALVRRTGVVTALQELRRPL
jgi:hypothetical protein